MPLLEAYVDMADLTPETKSLSLEPGFLQMCERVMRVLKLLIAFLVQMPEEKVEGLSLAAACRLTGLPCASRQQLLREQGLVLFDTGLCLPLLTWNGCQPPLWSPLIHSH